MKHDFEMRFRTDNAAFDDPDNTGAAQTEIARILRDIADRVERGSTAGRISDINGNSVGAWGFTLPGEDD